MKTKLIRSKISRYSFGPVNEPTFHEVNGKNTGTLITPLTFADEEGETVNGSVEFYFLPDQEPHGFSRNGSDSAGGWLSWDGNTLEDFDGSFFLPKSVGAALVALGYDVNDNFFATPLE